MAISPDTTKPRPPTRPAPAETARNAAVLRLVEVAALLAIGAFLVWTTRGFTFLQDEWDFIQYRLDWDADAFLAPHNQHLLAIDVLIFKVLFATVGIGDYLPYRLAGITMHLVVVALLFELARRRVGAALGAAVALPVAVLGCGWYLILFPLNLLWSVSLSALIGIVLLLDHDGRRHDAAASLLLLVALASSSFGIAASVGVAARLLLEPGARKRIWIVALPAAIYGLWFLVYGIDAERAPGYHLTASPVFVFHLAAAPVGALLGVPLGLTSIPARTLVVGGVHLLTLVLGVLLAGLLLANGRALASRVALPLGALLAYWLAITAARGWIHDPYPTHYIYVGAVLVAMVALEVAAGHELSHRVRVGLATGLCVSAALNAVALMHYADIRRDNSAVVRAEVGALELARATVASDFRPDSDSERAPSVLAGPLLAALDRLGSSPGDQPGEIAAAPESARAAADRVLLGARALTIQGVAGSGGRLPGCTRLGAGVHDLTLPTHGVVLRPADGREARLQLRRFASSFSDQATARITGPSRIAVAPDRAPQRWRLRVSSEGVVEAC